MTLWPSFHQGRETVRRTLGLRPHEEWLEEELRLRDPHLRIPRDRRVGDTTEMLIDVVFWMTLGRDVVVLGATQDQTRHLADRLTEFVIQTDGLIARHRVSLGLKPSKWVDGPCAECVAISTLFHHGTVLSTQRPTASVFLDSHTMMAANNTTPGNAQQEAVLRDLGCKRFWI